MFKKFLVLEWRAFFRSASFSANLVIKIFMALAALYFTAIFLGLGIGVFYIIREEYADPLMVINRFMIYYVVFDLIVRLFLQKIPVINIKPLLVLPIPKKTIVNFAIGKMLLSFFNFLQWFFFIPFSVVLLIEGYDVTGVIFWYLGMMSLIYANNFLNILLNNKDQLFYVFIALVAGCGFLQYYGVFDVTAYTSGFFGALYQTGWAFLIPVAFFSGLFVLTFRYLKKNLHLDTGLSKKHKEVHTEEFGWLNQFGTLGTFLKNDIRLLKRNKRSRSTLIMSFLFIFYGLLFFGLNISAYKSPMMQVFAGIFVSGGFLFTFGQFVPSWDSSYYQLMMSQNIQYRDYLTSKWWLMVIATVISTVIASFYLYFGWKVYMLIVVGAIYNIGVNSHLVLLGGAFVKTPIDLSSNRAAFGDRQAFNFKTLLISFPKLLVPMALYWIGSAIYSVELGFVLVALAGIAGFAFRNMMFSKIEKIYKNEKYLTIQAYKQNNN
jgi:hypothetical protein